MREVHEKSRPAQTSSPPTQTHVINSVSLRVLRAATLRRKRKTFLRSDLIGEFLWKTLIGRRDHPFKIPQLDAVFDLEAADPGLINGQSFSPGDLTNSSYRQHHRSTIAERISKHEPREEDRDVCILLIGYLQSGDPASPGWSHKWRSSRGRRLVLSYQRARTALSGTLGRRCNYSI